MSYCDISIAGIPRELLDLPNWLGFRFGEVRTNGKMEKIPVSPATGRKADPTSPRSWATFRCALKAARHNRLDGIGFAFDGKGISGIDLDCCRSDDGTLMPWAEEVIASVNTYSEVSPSGTGVHLFAFGKIPPGRNRNGSFEAYSKKRYFTVTGWHLPNTPKSVEIRPNEVRELCERYLGGVPAAKDRSGSANAVVYGLGDAEIIQRAAAARNGAKFSRLWSGDQSGYRTQSEADLALCSFLCFWAGPDAGRIDRLFRQSGLMRDKWDGKVYRELTVSLAVKSSVSYSEHQPVFIPVRTFAPVDPDAIAAHIRDSIPDGSLPRKMCKLERLRLACRLLQAHKQGQFFLACRMAGYLIGAGDRRAAQLIKLLIASGELKRVAGDSSRHAERLADEYILTGG